MKETSQQSDKAETGLLISWLPLWFQVSSEFPVPSLLAY